MGGHYNKDIFKQLQEAMWNSFRASFVFEHRNVSDLLREHLASLVS